MLNFKEYLIQEGLLNKIGGKLKHWATKDAPANYPKVTHGPVNMKHQDSKLRMSINTGDIGFHDKPEKPARPIKPSKTPAYDPNTIRMHSEIPTKKYQFHN